MPTPSQIITAELSGWRVPPDVLEPNAKAVFRATGRLLYRLEGDDELREDVLELNQRVEREFLVPRRRERMDQTPRPDRD